MYVDGSRKIEEEKMKVKKFFLNALIHHIPFFYFYIYVLQLIFDCYVGLTHSSTPVCQCKFTWAQFTYFAVMR